MNNNSINCVFIVQGEGRGHLMQALALKKQFDDYGYHVSTVLVGKSEKRQIPDFFLKKINAPVHTFESPNFVTDNEFKSINIYKSITYNLKYFRRYINSVRFIHGKIIEQNPMLIVNFFEPLTGLYNLFYLNSVPVISIAHQYIYQHPDFKFPARHQVQEAAIKFFTWMTGLRSELKIALSFYALERRDKKLTVTPPLLREEIFKIKTSKENYFLVYLLNQGLSDEIIRWHQHRPDIKIHCFWDKKEAEDVFEYDDTLTFHKINDKKFLSLMKNCKGLITTAGFESVCEAMYLKKPVFMIPVQGHFEQYCNARDAVKAGAGSFDNRFNIDFFVDNPLFELSKNKIYRNWMIQNNTVLMKEIKLVIMKNIQKKYSQKEYTEVFEPQLGIA